MDKLLAALSLPQVGDIRTIPIENDPERQGGLFDIELKSRVYTLRAKNDMEAETWVKALKQIRDQGSLAVPPNITQRESSSKAADASLKKSNIRQAEGSASSNSNANNTRKPLSTGQEDPSETAQWKKENRRRCCWCF